jgi:hypothetical protein
MKRLLCCVIGHRFRVWMRLPSGGYWMDLDHCERCHVKNPKRR